MRPVHWLYTIPLRLRSLFHRRQADQELDDELRDHLERKTDEYVSHGMTQKEASRRARIDLGGIEQTKEKCRDTRRVNWIQDFVEDLHFGLRMLRKAPGFTAVALLTLALGIGANTAVFSVVNAVLLRPLAYQKPNQLYLIQVVWSQMSKFYPMIPANFSGYQIWRKQCHSFEDISIAEDASADLTGSGEPVEIHGVRGSANLFALLGVTPALGRDFLPIEDESGRGRVVVLTNRFWRGYFRSDATVIGRAITLDGVPFTVVGVLPASFHFPAQLGQLTSFGREIDFFEPLNGPKDEDRDLVGEFDFAALGRLRAGVKPDQALAELNVIQAQISEEVSKTDTGVDLKAAIIPLESEVVGAARRGLILLLAAVGVVVLIVCVNLANMMLSRIPARMREAAIRMALGATRWQLFRRMLTESLLLGVLGGALGVWLGSLGVVWLVQTAPPGLPRLDEVHMDSRVLWFAVALSLLTSILSGILPAWRASKGDVQEALKTGGAGAGESQGSRRLREALIGIEVGMSTALLIVAGLLTSSLLHLLRVNPGFATEKVLTVDVDLPPQRYSETAVRLHFYNALLDLLRGLPGVHASGWVSRLPLEGETSVSGLDVPPGGPFHFPANFRVASLDYFAAVGMRLLHGRIFSESDRGRKVVVVSESAAQRFWPGQNPIGRTCLTFWGGKEEDEVIGVVSDVRTVKLDAAPVMMVYVPDWFGGKNLRAPQSAGIVVRTYGDERSVEASVREAVHTEDSEVPIVAMRSMAEIVSDSVAPRRFQMLLALLFAGSALFLASLGIYGVIAYSIEQRRPELGIRSALGAQVSDLHRMVLRQGMSPVMAGLVAGLSISLVIGRLMKSLLFSVKATDPLTMGTVAFLVTIVALLACFIPARRASRVHPMVALRYE
jgi:predicted permease